MLRQLELIASEGRDARLDATGADGDQGQADQGKFTGNKRRHKMSERLVCF